MNILVPSWSPPPLVAYPERQEGAEHWLDGIEKMVTSVPQMVAGRLHRRHLRGLVQRINATEVALRGETGQGLAARISEVRAALRCHGLTDINICLGFAIVREVSRRTIGLRHLDVQILAGLAMLKGRVAEMDTGEGKTLTAGLPASIAALAGLPVHVITVNDYLAARDRDILRPIYDILGLTTGLVNSTVPRPERPAAYACDIVYASNKEIAFDYLRDRITFGGQPRLVHAKINRMLDERRGREPPSVMRGLHFAIVDEADSVLVDEARTPLIISQETDADGERQWVEQTFALIDGFKEPAHYRLLVDERRLELTETGKAKLAERAEAIGGIWRNRIRREEAASQALVALRLFRKGEHYLVSDGKVQIIDEYTGRVMPDRSWSDGLHQLVEGKEGCEITSRKLTMARMTYQRFFRRYLHLAGMTGTAREITEELRHVYGLQVMRIPPNAPSRRTKLPTTICPTLEDKWLTIVRRVRELQTAGRPVLIATRSVSASEAVSAVLQGQGIEHRVLNAEQSSEEAEIIAQAGGVCRVTVVTNMAGRGVDIAVAPEALALGGLHVLLSERHDAGRIDRQMEGRTARKGDPGSTEAILSLEDPLLDLIPWQPLRLLGRCGKRAGLWLFHLAQRRAERTHARDRKNLLAQDRRLGTLLAFSGLPE
ncbi:preprotein translocase subunit SecA [Ensifer sesbaniae]|uniref:preprotein translocase subunit SecA n=1 Tax=Ensifer sesbaniae TaxID=1214071 RepID=UPI001FE4FC9E|nr:preprotein translocase subunit SecA [Ensifer sesbaniae]NRQ16434.1 Protein translocase subunit SecA [Ensifer sesbaniae]